MVLEPKIWSQLSNIAADVCYEDGCVQSIITYEEKKRRELNFNKFELISTLIFFIDAFVAEYEEEEEHRWQKKKRQFKNDFMDKFVAVTNQRQPGEGIKGERKSASVAIPVAWQIFATVGMSDL